LKKYGLKKPDKSNIKRVLTLEDVDLVLNSAVLPFVVDKGIKEDLKKQRSKYEELVKEYDELESKMPKIEEFDGMLKKLQELLFISPEESAIE
jgi:hypothetical protein